jgi:AraC family transcriptional regulator of adaptative response / DNA-3-methyladenine glycosylase II
VCRAVQLIVDGALDGSTEAELGARLGVSVRHLRRLFNEHVGVTPDQLARSRRAHFARRLLDDTDMTIADIAFAAGFGSVRQLNRACLDVFRSTPGELRARRRSTDRLVADGTYRRTLVIDGDPGVLEISAGGPDHLLLRAHLPHWEGLIHVVQRARRIFNLDAEVDGARERLGPYPLIGALVRKRPGLRMPGAWDAYEIGVRAIIGQQVSVAGATTITGRIVERLGSPVPGLAAFGLTHTFPAPDTLAEAELDGIGMPGRRVAAIRSFARAVAEGDIHLDRRAGLDELVASIVAIPGLGPWTANYIALRLGEPDAFPEGDLGLRRSAEMLGAGPISAAGAAGLGAIAQGWRPWRSTAAVHLWLASHQ